MPKRKTYNRRNIGRGEKQWIIREERNYSGKAGRFLPEQKILMRIDASSPAVEVLTEKIMDIIELTEIADESVLKLGVEVAYESLQKYTPRDTGRLADSWEVYVDENGRIAMENPVPYMMAQNYGKNGEMNGRGPAFYPGYYMMERAYHDAYFAMLQEQERLNQMMLRELGLEEG